jgi:hypothetical protein
MEPSKPAWAVQGLLVVAIGLLVMPDSWLEAIRASAGHARFGASVVLAHTTTVLGAAVGAVVALVTVLLLMGAHASFMASVEHEPRRRCQCFRHLPCHGAAAVRAGLSCASPLGAKVKMALLLGGVAWVVSQAGSRACGNRPHPCTAAPVAWEALQLAGVLDPIQLPRWTSLLHPCTHWNQLRCFAGPVHTIGARVVHRVVPPQVLSLSSNVSHWIDDMVVSASAHDAASSGETNAPSQHLPDPPQESSATRDTNAPTQHLPDPPQESSATRDTHAPTQHLPDPPQESSATRDTNAPTQHLPDPPQESSASASSPSLPRNDTRASSSSTQPSPALAPTAAPSDGSHDVPSWIQRLVKRMSWSTLTVVMLLFGTLLVPSSTLRLLWPPSPPEWPRDRPTSRTESLTEQVDEWAASLGSFRDPDPGGEWAITPSWALWAQQDRPLVAVLTRMQARAASLLSRPSGQSDDLAMRIALASIHRKAARMERPPPSAPVPRRRSNPFAEPLDPLQILIAQAASQVVDPAVGSRFAKWMTNPS